MALIYGKQFSPNRATIAQGEFHDAAIRRHSNSVDLAVEGGGTTNMLLVGRVRAGNVPHSASISSTSNASSITFGLGTAAAPTKYGAAVTGPTAGATVQVSIPPAMLATLLATDEEIILTPSGALPATGTLVASFNTSKR